MSPGPLENPVVHLELRTTNLARACTFYAQLFGWRPSTVHAGSGSYLRLDLGCGIQGGVAECETEQPLWLPYVEVADIREAAERARELGAGVVVEPREGPAGWRCVLTVPAGGEVALWQSKK
jgi:predicted enzyme related to lactoylglutathione lyase